MILEAFDRVLAARVRSTRSSSSDSATLLQVYQGEGSAAFVAFALHNSIVSRLTARTQTLPVGRVDRNRCPDPLALGTSKTNTPNPLLRCYGVTTALAATSFTLEAPETIGSGIPRLIKGHSGLGPCRPPGSCPRRGGRQARCQSEAGWLQLS